MKINNQKTTTPMTTATPNTYKPNAAQYKPTTPTTHPTANQKKNLSHNPPSNQTHPTLTHDYSNPATTTDRHCDNKPHPPKSKAKLQKNSYTHKKQNSTKYTTATKITTTTKSNADETYTRTGTY